MNRSVAAPPEIGGGAVRSSTRAMMLRTTNKVAETLPIRYSPFHDGSEPVAAISGEPDILVAAFIFPSRLPRAALRALLTPPPSERFPLHQPRRTFQSSPRRRL